MKNMTLKNIAAAVGGELYAEKKDEERVVDAVEIDSRLIGKNGLFIATVGERVDGHSFIDDVFSKGAAAVISEKKLDDPKGPYIKVRSSFEALEKLAAFYRQQISVKVVGITGSVGKTSTKEVVASVLSQKYKCLKTEGNLNNNVGLPLMVLRIRDEEVAVLEMGISHFGEMTRLSESARPDIAIITNIGTSHMENLGSREGIFEEKSHITDFLAPDGLVIVNGDDDILGGMDEVNGHKVVKFGRGDKADVRLTEERSLGLEGNEFVIEGRLPGGRIKAAASLVGYHMVINAACAALTANELGLTADEIIKGIASVKAISGRSNVIKTDNLTIIDDCYNANPDSMRAAIKTAALAKGRKVLILGDMFELGETERKLHREVGSFIASEESDEVITIGNLAKEIAEGAKENGVKNVHYFETKEDFRKEEDKLIKNGDTVLVKASHGMHFEEIVEELKERGKKAAE